MKNNKVELDALMNAFLKSIPDVDLLKDKKEKSKVTSPFEEIMDTIISADNDKVDMKVKSFESPFDLIKYLAAQHDKEDEDEEVSPQEKFAESLECGDEVLVSNDGTHFEKRLFWGYASGDVLSPIVCISNSYNNAYKEGKSVVLNFWREMKESGKPVNYLDLSKFDVVIKSKLSGNSYNLDSISFDESGDAILMNEDSGNEAHIKDGRIQCYKKLGSVLKK